MFKSVDCLLLHVPELDTALEFYRDKLGHKLIWRRGNDSAGLAMDESATELVLVTGAEGQETDVVVRSVKDAVGDFKKAGGKVTVEPFEIKIGWCAVIQDPWGNDLVILDTSKGLLKTDSEGNVKD